MNHKKTRLLFLFIFPFLFAQMYYCYHYPEPFPAIMMPRFGHQQNEKNAVSYTDVDLIFNSNTGNKYPIDRHELLNSMHLPQRVHAMRKVFSIDSEAEKNLEFMIWLKNGIKDITGENNGQLEVRWHRVSISNHGNNLSRKREGIEIKIINIQ